jgi:hypothetical protein
MTGTTQVPRYIGSDNTIHDSTGVVPTDSAGDPIVLDASTIYRLGAAVGNETTAVAVKASKGTVNAIYLYNAAASLRYLKLYNIAAGSVVPASSTPLISIAIPASTLLCLEPPAGIKFDTAISYRLVTGQADTNITNVTAADITDLSIHYN